jgi:hypothetical protein
MQGAQALPVTPQRVRSRTSRRLTKWRVRRAPVWPEALRLVGPRLGGTFKRQSTDRWEWDAAREVVVQWESACVWAIPVEMSSPEIVQVPSGPAVPTIKRSYGCVPRQMPEPWHSHTTFAKYHTFVRQSIRANGLSLHSEKLAANKPGSI